MKALLFAVALVFLSVDATSAESAPEIEGVWVSAEPEPDAPLFFMREFRFEGGKWSSVERVFADPDGETLLFAVESGGMFVIGGPSPRFKSAYEAILPANRRSIVVNGEAGAVALAGMGCPVRNNEILPLIETGCGFLPSLMQSMGDYALIKQEGDRLWLGKRNDPSRAQPEGLSPYPLLRR